MQLLQTITEFIQLYSWRDIVEILFFSYIIYRFLYWLRSDTQKQLVWYMYAYWASACVAHYTGLTIISQVLFVAAPVIISIFIIIHQQILQKNFIAFTKLAKPVHSYNWFDEFTRTNLYAMNRSKNIIWIIERTNHLGNAIHAQCMFHAELKKDLIELLLEATPAQESVFWINAHGTLIATQITMQTPDAVWISKQAQQIPDWQQEALLLCSKTDAIVIRSCSTSRTFTIIIHDKMIDELSAEHMLLILKQVLNQPNFREEIPYAPTTSKSSHKQHHS